MVLFLAMEKEHSYLLKKQNPTNSLHNLTGTLKLTVGRNVSSVVSRKAEGFRNHYSSFAIEKNNN
jgi:hypothetical protein